MYLFKLSQTLSGSFNSREVNQTVYQAHSSEFPFLTVSKNVVTILIFFKLRKESPQEDFSKMRHKTSKYI